MGPMANIHKNRPLQVLPLGIGDAFTAIDYNCSLLLMAGQNRCLVDCPDPIHRIFAERLAPTGVGVNVGNIDDIVLTHLHGDHCNGLESFLFYRKFIASAPPVRIHALPEVADVLWKHKLAPAMERTSIPELGLEQTFKPEEFFTLSIVEEGQPFDIGDLHFEIRRTLHSIPTFGFCVSYDGRTFGYSCDTTFDLKHIEFLSKSDIIFHDCNESLIHTPYESLASISGAVHDKIHILHLADSFDRSLSVFPIVKTGEIYTV